MPNAPSALEPGGGTTKEAAWSVASHNYECPSCSCGAVPDWRQEAPLRCTGCKIALVPAEREPAIAETPRCVRCGQPLPWEGVCGDCVAWLRMMFQAFGEPYDRQLIVRGMKIKRDIDAIYAKD